MKTIPLPLLLSLAALVLRPAIASAANPVAHWPLDGNATELVSNLNGTLVGVPQPVAGRTGQAFQFSGAEGVSVPASPTLSRSAFTLAAWVYIPGSIPAGWRTIVEHNRNGNNWYGLWKSSNGNKFHFRWSSSGTRDFNQSIVPDQWYLVVGTYANGVARLYLNGELDSEVTGASAPAPVEAALRIGLNLDSAEGFLGWIDEVQVYGAALTAEDVANLYSGAFGPVTFVEQPASVTVIENAPVTFSARLSGRPPCQMQWFQNEAPIAGATNLTLTFTPMLADDQARFRLWATNVVNGTDYSAASSNAVLTVLPDTTPPALVRVANRGVDLVTVTFSEPVRDTTATNLANYALNGPAGAVSLLNATLTADGLTVTLFCSPLLLGETYTLVVNHVQDRAATPNVIAPDTADGFATSALPVSDLGSPAVLGQLRAVPGGFDFTAGGTGVGGTSDQLSFGAEGRTGDFDLAVRVDALALSDAWARAGLMVREGLTTNGAFAAAWATPGPAGCFFQSRAATGGGATTTGAFPANHPHTWLRLRRTGNVFDGLAGIDGAQWSLLGSMTLALPATLQVGLAVSAHSTNATTTAAFRDLGDARGVVVTNPLLPFERMAPCSRRTGLVISEIMFNPPDAWSTGSLEFVELHNPDLFAEDIGGYRLAGDVEFTLPRDTILPSGGSLVIARNPAALEAFYGISGVLGPYTNNLPNEGGALFLVNDVGGRVLEVEYRDEAPWPVAADGAGHSLVLRRPSYGEGDPRAWGPSDVLGGSPGRGDGWGPEPMRAVVINELLANSDAPGSLDFIELYNASTQPVELGGAWLSDDLSTAKYQLPANTVLPPRAFLTLTETQLGFALSSEGDELVLWNASRTRVLDALRFGAQAPDTSRGRQPDGSPLWSELATPTPGTTNSAALSREMVIHEIMYHPLSGSEDDEYVELLNRGPHSVDLGGWRLRDGISYTFPASVIVPAGGFAVVAKNRTHLLARYAQLTTANTFGNFNGSLKNCGERLALEMPLVTLRTNAQGLVTTNVTYVLVNEVTYGDSGRWGQWSDGGGSSLELVDPRADNRFAAHWADSDETGKAPWTTVDFTGLLDLGMTQSQGTPDRFEILMQNAGECLMDELECRSAADLGVNRLANGGFEGTAADWNSVGTHRRSFIESGVGVGGSKALHVVATGRGDPNPNKVWARVATLPTGLNGTLRAKVRWLKGSRYCLLRVRGNWIEAEVVMDVPANLGTPGLPNSRRLANAGPAIADVTHAPVLPAAGQAVVVSARLSDPDGVGAVTLRYRIDPSATLTSVTMTDDGSGGDVLAGDGIYSGTIPGRAANTLVAFHISATDAAASPASRLFPSDAPGRECLVRFGETELSGIMGTYRVWLSQATVNAWIAREPNSNEPLEATFACDNHRVIYNAGTLYSGSPWHASSWNGPLGSTLCDYELNFAGDDRFLGARDFVLSGQSATESNPRPDASGQAEFTCYWFGRRLGLSYNHKRVVHVVVNGQRRGLIFYDHQQPNGDYLAEYFPEDDQGRLHKIEDWFEFNDAGLSFNQDTARLLNHTTVGGVKKTARYRYNFRPRAVTGSPNDFGPLFQLVDAVHAPRPEPYTAATLAHADLEEWMRVLAVHNAVGSWDSYGNLRGKNCYAYKPERAPWRLLIWDLELVMDKMGDPPTADLFDLGSPSNPQQGEPTIAAMWAHPPFVRAYWRALWELAHGPMQPAQYWPRMTHRHQAYLAQGLPVLSPQSTANWIDQRRTYILQRIATAATATFTASGPAQTTGHTVTLTGTAPVNAQDILVNGRAYPITWTSPVAWAMNVPVAAGLQELVVTARDASGAGLTNLTVTIEAIGEDVSPVGWVVFNEIMYDPVQPGTSYVELFNRSPTVTFDLSDWRINGLDFTFAPGTVITNGQYLVVAKNRFAYAATHGPLKLVAGEFAGELDNGGETLSLLQPGPTLAEDVIVDRVRYDNEAPWPLTAAGQGAALQLRDAAQDNARVSNWSDGTGWRFFSYTGTSSQTGSRLSLYLENSGGDLWLDDLSLVLASGPNAGTNLLCNGGFETPLTPDWSVGPACSNSVIVTDVARSGAASLRFIMNPAAPSLTHFYQDLAPAIPANTPCTLSFWYLPGSVGTNLTLRFSSTFRPVVEIAPADAAGNATPDAANSVVAMVPPYPSLWLNEVQPENRSGLADHTGDRDPWIELYNPGPEPVTLAGLSLADTFTSLKQWNFPVNATIGAGQFLVVWVDGEPAETTDTELHASFRLTPTNGVIVLAQEAGGLRILDYVNYHAVPADRTHAAVPDGQPFYREVLFYPTPGEPNNTAAPPVVLYINEWMAANNSAGGFADPADGDYDDWFELYNPGDTPVHLEGSYLTDTLTNPTQYRIPGGYVVPAGGFLLVWADGETGQNGTHRADLHVNFQLRQAGEAIGLFAADGTLIDAVTFGPQTNNVSEGRFPDGAGPRCFMTTPTPRAANVLVAPPAAPTLTGIALDTGGRFSFAFTGQTGHAYQVEYAEDLAAPLWVPLGGPISGTGDVRVVVDEAIAARQRFYRVRWVP